MTRFEELTDDLLLRIPSFRTDSATRNFLNKYCPLLAVELPGNWSSQPPSLETVTEMSTRHSLIFSRHPFLDINIKEGRLDVLTKEKENKVSGYLTYHVCLFFINEKDATDYFGKLCSDYNGLCSTKTLSSKPDRKAAIFRQDSKPGPLTQMQLLLSKDDIYDNRYKIIMGIILDMGFEEYYESQYA